MIWRCRIAALLLLVGIVLSPLRAVAAMIPVVIVYDVPVPVPRTATVRVEAGPSLRPELGGVREYVYDDAHDRYDDASNPPVAGCARADRAYDRALELAERSELGDGLIYDAPAATLAAEGSTALVEGGEVWNARGGIDFSKSTAFEGQVQIPYTGSRMLDYQAANQAAGLGDSMRAPAGFVWHHLDDYNALTNTGTMQLVDQAAHMANAPHIGGVAQWVEWMGVPYAP